MSEPYYKSCRELDICNELIEKYFHTQQYEKCFAGHLELAQQGYPLAECQIGYFYYEGLGVEKDLAKAVYWTRRAADHGDRDGQCNLAWFHEDAIGVERDLEQAIFWYRKAALQGHDLAIEKCRAFGVDLNAPNIDRETIRKELQCRIYPLGYLERYKYTVICSNYNGKWILSRHKKRDTWETQGGHIEDGETPPECAKRELFEESGIQDADIYPVCDYWGFNRQACSNGMVFLAVVHSLGELPESEMKETKIFDTLPAELTYPQTSPKLYAEAEKMLKGMTKKDMRIETPRMIIRHFTPNDAADLYEILGDNETMEHCEPAYDFEKTKEFLTSFCIERRGAVAAVHKESGKLIGYILFNEQGYGVYEMGWFFNRSFWRQGYAYESCKAVIDYAFGELGAHKIFAETIDAERSAGLMQKLGMQLEGIQHSQTKDLSGNWRDLYFYGLLQDDRRDRHR